MGQISYLIAKFTAIRKAFEFAKMAHGDQKRKYTGEPYIEHPVEVASLVCTTSQLQRDEVVQAALLHDVLEDTDATEADLRREFGDQVTALVLEVTDVSKPSDGNRKVRKELDHQHLANASAEGQTIKLADLVSNTASITTHDPDFAKVYMREKRELLKVLTKGDSALRARANGLVAVYFALNGREK